MTPDISTMETPRLRGEAVGEHHLPLLIALWQDPQVMANLVGGVRSETECRERLNKMVLSWAQFGIERWALFDKQTDAFAGVGGLRHIIADGWPEIELGFAFHAAYWGKGLATEVAQAALEAGFHRLGCEHIRAMALTHHAASRRVLEKVGMTFDREMLYRDAPHAVNEITRARWAELHSSK